MLSNTICNTTPFFTILTTTPCLEAGLPGLTLIMSDPVPSSPPPPQEDTPPSLPQLHIHATTRGPSVFEQTTQNLLKLGSLTIDKFAQDHSEELDVYDIPLVDPANPNAAGYYLGDTTAVRHQEEESDEIPNVPPTEAVRYLRAVSKREFGTTSTDPLKYEFLDEVEQNREWPRRFAFIVLITGQEKLVS